MCTEGNTPVPIPATGLRHAAGADPWTACGLPLADVYVDPRGDISCPACRRLPIAAARLLLEHRDPTALRRLAAAAIRAADDLDRKDHTMHARTVDTEGDR